MKILLLRFSSIGDIVLTTPVVRAIKTQLNDCEVHYATKSAFAGMLQQNPYVDKVFTLDKSGLNALIGQLALEKYDCVIDLHNNLRTLIIKSRLGVKSYSFNKLNWQKWLMVNFKVNTLPNRHIVDRYLDTVATLGVKPDALGLDYFIPQSDEVPTDWLPNSHQSGFVVVAVGAQHATKRLPTNRLIELCDRINRPIVLLGGKEDKLVGDEIELFFAKKESSARYESQLEKELNKKAVVFNGCGKFSLNQSASLVKQAQAVFTHDTGLMHIAAAFKQRIFSIWGSTIPEFGMYPYKAQFTVFENKKIGCRPCSKIGHNKCPLGHFKCMNDLVFDFYLP